MPCGKKTAIKKAIQNQMTPWQSAIQNFICISRHRHLALLPGWPGNRQLGIILVFAYRQSAIRSWISRPSATSNSIWIRTYSEFLFWIVGQPAVRKLSALAVWFGFQGNRQFGILGGFRAIGTWEFDLDFRAIFNWEVYLDFKQLATGIILTFVWRQSAVGNFIWIWGNQQLGF